MVWALGLFYGCLGIVAGLLIITAGFPKILISSNGLLFGLYSTWIITTQIHEISPTQTFSGYLPGLKIAYLFLAFYLSIAIPRLLGGRGYSKEKYDALLSGVFGLSSGYLLGLGFGANAAVFSGLLFLSCTFIGMYIVEKLFSPLLWALRAVLGEKYFSYIDLERGYAARTVWFGVKTAWYQGRQMVVAAFILSTVFPFLVALLYYFLLEGQA